MKAKLIGLIVLILVIAGAVGYKYYQKNSRTEQISGYVGGEKIGLLEDEEVKKILRSKYHLTVNYYKAGSLDMVTADKTGKDYLFPSSQTALELYEEKFGKPEKSEIILNTPIVIYTHKAVADALTQQGIVSSSGDVSYVDMQKLLACIENDTKWEDIGLSQLYGTVSIGTTDPTKSNSGNMFAGLIANTLAGGTADADNIDAALPEIKQIFSRLGYMETSSADIFSQFLKMGMGAKPMIAGYESQLLEFAYEHPDDWKELKDDIVMLYPNPTVWSSHVYIALDDTGTKGIDALLDPDIQKLAWEKHGFRTGVSTDKMDVNKFDVPGVLQQVDRVSPMPDAGTMMKIIETLSQ